MSWLLLWRLSKILSWWIVLIRPLEFGSQSWKFGRLGSRMKKRDGLPKGVMRREAKRDLVCDVRFTHCDVKGKFHAKQIESLEEGAFFYDIVKLYEKRVGCGSMKKRLLELNYPQYSPYLRLTDLPQDFHIMENKGQAQKLILEQARRAARVLIQRQNFSGQVVDGSQSTLKNQNSPHRNAQDLTLRVAEDQLDLDGMHASHGVQSGPTHEYDTIQHNDVDQVHAVVKDFHERVCELLEQCRIQYTSKVEERKDLERRVAGVNEALGIISLPNPKSEKFYECLAFIKQIIRRDGELSRSLENFEQTYKSEESRCWELRKGLEDHNLKSISESLIGNHEIEREVEVLHVIRSFSELLVKSPKDVLQNPWVPLFFSPDSNGGIWDLGVDKDS